MHEIIKNRKGVFESPKALKIDDKILKKAIGINPIEIVLRYVTAKGKVFLGVCKRFNKNSENIKPIRAITKEVINII